MFSKGRYKPGKNQINGRLKPQMLASQQRAIANKNKQAARKQKPNIVLKDLSAHEPHININLGNVRIPMLFLLLIIVPQVLADANMQRIIIDGVKMHGKPVELLPPDANCRANSVGVSKGSICQFGETTHYMKLLTPSETRRTRDLSYQAFNHHFAESNIGIKTAKFRFFKQTASDQRIYIASEHVNDIKFITKQDSLNTLKPSDIAKWAVASTFIFDLHANNVGYTEEGIVALDLDGHDRPLTTHLLTNIVNAAHSINTHTPWLSLNDIRGMKKIYSEMQNKPLPDHHDSFHLTEKMYQDMLSAFINICEKVITIHEATFTVPEHSRRDGRINALWCQTAKDYLSLKHRLKTHLYNDLCDMILTSEYQESRHFY